jgi:YVTN family beta-propeller protein
MNTHPVNTRGSIGPRRSIAAVTAAALAWLIAPTPVLALNAYITGSNTVSVIDTATNTVIATVPVGGYGVAVTPDGSRVYVTTRDSVTVIDTATNMVIGSPIPVDTHPIAVAVTPDGSRAYVLGSFGSVTVIDTTTNTVVPPEIITLHQGAGGIAVTPDGSKVYAAITFSHYSCDGALAVISTVSNTVINHIGAGCSPGGVAVSPDGSRVYATGELLVNIIPPMALGVVSVIDTATDTVITLVTVGVNPFGVAVSPEGSKVYVTNSGSVSVIDTATNTVVDAIPVGSGPTGLALTPDGSKLYVADTLSNAVSVIDTATNTKLVPPIPVGQDPIAFGIFIQPVQPGPKFAGTPGSPNCHGKSVSALAQQFGGLARAADNLGFASVSALQDTIKAFCDG